jgi:hypothetical protein
LVEIFSASLIFHKIIEAYAQTMRYQVGMPADNLVAAPQVELPFVERIDLKPLFEPGFVLHNQKKPMLH